MRILVVSDIHGRRGHLELALEQQPSAAAVAFLGDGWRETEEAAQQHPERTFYMVPGNGDFAVMQPAVLVEMLGGKRFFLTHGHRYGVKYGLLTLQAAARERQAQVVLFGHTHVPYQAYEDGVWYLNPGSLGYDGSYGYVDVVNGGVVTNVTHIRR